MYRVVVAAAAGIAAAGLLCLNAPARADIVVNISKSQQRLAVMVDGKELYRWPVSTGRRGLETPSGKFRPVRFERDWYSRQYDRAPMPHSIFFYRGYAVHGSNDVKRLGRPASHGCVRLEPANASTLFDLVLRESKESKKDARIVVMNGPLPEFVPPVQQAPKPAPVPAVPAPVKPAPMIDPNPNIFMSEMAPAPNLLPASAAAAAAPAAVASSFAMAEPADTAPPQAKESQEKPPQAKSPQDQPRAAAPKAVKVAALGAAHDSGPFVSVGDEASVMRGRQAWLRSPDRKYGIR